MRVLALVDAVLGYLDLLARWIAGGALLIMTIVLFGSSVSRSVFDWALVGSDEIGRVLAIWTTFLGAFVVVRANRHVAIDILLRLVSDRWFRLLTAVIGTVGGLTMAYVAWHGGDLAWRVFKSGQVSAVLPMMKVVFYLPVPIGGGLMTLAFFMLAAKAAAGTLERPPELAPIFETGATPAANARAPILPAGDAGE